MNDKYYYSAGKKRKGPVTLDELKQFAERGVLKKHDKVWAQGFDGWRNAGSCPEIFREFQGAASTTVKNLSGGASLETWTCAGAFIGLLMLMFVFPHGIVAICAIAVIGIALISRFSDNIDRLLLKIESPLILYLISGIIVLAGICSIITPEKLNDQLLKTFHRAINAKGAGEASNEQAQPALVKATQTKNDQALAEANNAQEQAKSGWLADARDKGYSYGRRWAEGAAKIGSVSLSQAPSNMELDDYAGRQWLNFTWYEGKEFMNTIDKTLGYYKYHQFEPDLQRDWKASFKSGAIDALKPLVEQNKRSQAPAF